MKIVIFIRFVWGTGTGSFTISFLLCTFKASDLDLGINSKLRYSILNGTSKDKFRVDPNTGEVFSTIPLDREEKRLHQFTVLVEDMEGNKSYGHILNDSAIVVVLVEVR